MIRRVHRFLRNSGGPNQRQTTEKLSEDAQRSQRLWDSLIPERNIGLTHPMFAVLFVLTASLHFYNKSQDEKREEELKAARLARQASKEN